jgi:pimeloyl-ACP methyl ester carboxylesterase
VDSTDVVLDVVAEAIDALVPGRYALVGQSYGGYLARGLLARSPDRVTGMALVCPMLVADHADRDVPEHSVIAADPDLTSRLDPGSEFLEIAVVQTEATFRRTQEEVVVGLEVADDDALERIRGGWAGAFPREPEGTRYAGPTLVLTGRQDSSTGYRDAWPLLEHYPRATFAVLDRAGHNAHIEQPVLFRALVDEWLDRVEESLRGS